ncbi:MAG: extracellular solute-binding protein [Elusimicrobia bacterium]|nr:extracellular solute-binding protein [Elusimicrobiota bacterium]
MKRLAGLLLFAYCILTVTVVFAEPIKLVYWHYFTDRDAVLKKIAADFEKQTGIQVDVQNYGPPEAYDRRLNAATRGKALPDLITITLNINNYAAYVRGGHFLDLTPYMDKEWRSSIPENYLRGFTFTADDLSVYGVKKAGLYGLPVDANCMAIFYNTKLWEKAGLKGTPKTWDEFLSAGRKLRAAGIDPFVAHFYGQQWENHTFWMNYAFAYLGTKGFTDLAFGRVKFSDPRVVKSFKIFADMRDAKLFINGITGGILGEDIFPQNKVAMWWFGSWEIGVWKQTAPNFQDFDVFYPPKPADATNPCLLPGGPGAAITVNANGKNTEAAVKFVKYLTSKAPQLLYAESSQNIPVNLNARKEMKAGSKLAKFVPWMGSLFYGQYQNPTLWGEMLSKINIEIQSIIMGEKTPEQVCKFLDEEYERIDIRFNGPKEGRQ